VRKQVLVSVDPEQTRVALLEASGQPSKRRGGRRGGSRTKKEPSGDYRVAELYLERRGARSR
jgi:hypothetical protein